jgi:hypothetical protein
MTTDSQEPILLLSEQDSVEDDAEIAEEKRQQAMYEEFLRLKHGQR